MRVIIVADEKQQKEILSKKTSPDIKLIFAENDSHASIDNYDVIFYLTETSILQGIKRIYGKPVFISSVIETLKDLNLPDNFTRINGWPGFLDRPLWEAATIDTNAASAIFKELGWNITFVKDEPGLVSARIISMIINEAFFALEEKISSKEDINTAMKLGTNYPYGPFEWQEKIGIENIYLLLHKLSITDKRYAIAPLLKNKYFETTPAL
jgi:3-hydroxybutyryl-CoA dehydrogenase